MTGKSVVLKLSGLHCAACASRVENALKALAGVEEATVNLDALLADVRYDSKKTGIGQMINAVTEIGYGAEVEEGEG